MLPVIANDAKARGKAPTRRQAWIEHPCVLFHVEHIVSIKMYRQISHCL